MSEKFNPSSYESSANPPALFNKQMTWMAAEMGYSRAKDGYATKLERFNRDPDAPGSVLANMSSYWNRFENDTQALFEPKLSDQDRLQLAARSLIFIGKTTAGIADKVGLAVWLNQGRQDKNHTNDALGFVRGTVNNHLRANPQLTYYGLLGEGANFAATDMGVRILAMHNIVRDGIGDPDAYRGTFGSWSETLLETARAAALASICVWQTHTRRLATMGLKPDMPKPGVSGGAVEAWDSPAAKLWP